jgi:hypothetical protein
MSAVTAVRHLKARWSDGGITLEPCEDRGCEVDASGHAGCGRLACPACGFSGANLSTQQLSGQGDDQPIACECGHLWVAPTALTAQSAAPAQPAPV